MRAFAARLAAFMLAALVLAGCAVPPKAPAGGDAQVWTGRLALTVEGHQSQSFSAGFELRGQPEAGQLTLYNPLGGTLAVLAWTPKAATLRSGPGSYSGGSPRGKYFDQFETIDPALGEEAPDAGGN